MKKKGMMTKFRVLLASTVALLLLTAIPKGRADDSGTEGGGNRVANRILAHHLDIEAGRVVLQGTPKDLEEHEDVREAYLGLGAAEAASPRGWRLYRKRRRW